MAMVLQGAAPDLGPSEVMGVNGSKGASGCRVEAVGSGDRTVRLELLLNCCRQMVPHLDRCRREDADGRNTSD